MMPHALLEQAFFPLAGVPVFSIIYLDSCPQYGTSHRAGATWQFLSKVMMKRNAVSPLQHSSGYGSWRHEPESGLPAAGYQQEPAACPAEA